MTSVLRGLLGFKTLAKGFSFSTTASFLISLLGACLMASAFWASCCSNDRVAPGGKGLLPFGLGAFSLVAYCASYSAIVNSPPLWPGGGREGSESPPPLDDSF
jgi:hypothetical protein